MIKGRKKNIIDFKRIYWFFIWRNLNPLHPRMLCDKFGWNWLSGSGEEFFLISSMYFHYFVIISPWKRAGPFNLNKLESPSPKDALCQVWLKLAQWSWRRRFFNFVNVFSLFRNYLPLVKGGPFIWTNLNPLHPRMLCAKFGWNWPSGSGGEDENVKSLQADRQTDRQTDGRTDRRRTTGDQKSSLKLSAQVS